MATDNSIKPYTHNGLMSPAYFLIIAGLATDESIFTRFLGNKFFLLLGNSSYALYLFQFPVFLVLVECFGTDQLNGLHFYLFAGILMLVSIGVYLGFEKPARKWLVDKWLGSRRSAKELE